MTEASPFVPGARVAVETSRNSYREDRVLKVHKSGNFTLASDARQQWRPWKGPHNARWSAIKTGGGAWPTNMAFFWAADDHELSERVVKAALTDRARDILWRLSKADPSKATDKAVSLLEAALKEIDHGR